MAPSDFSALSFFAGSVIAHLARRVVGVVVSVAVGTGDWVIADGEALLSVLLVDVGFFALFACNVVVSFLVSSSAAAAPDRAVGVDFVAEFPATGALNEIDFLDPLGAEAWGVEEEDGFANKSLKVCLVWVWNAEADVAAGFGRDAVSVGPSWAFDEHGVFKNIARLSDLGLKFGVGDWYEFAWEHPSVLINDGVFISDPFLGWNVADNYP